MNRHESKDQQREANRRISRLESGLQSDTSQEATNETLSSGFFAQAVGSVMGGDPSFDVYNVKPHLGGKDPRIDQEDQTEQVTVKKLGNGELEPDDWVEVALGEDDEWYCLVPVTSSSGGGGSSGEILAIQVYDTKTNDQAVVEGRIIDNNGNVITPPAAKFTVPDKQTRLNLVEGGGPTEVAVDDIIEQIDVKHIFQYNGGGTGDENNWTDLGPSFAQVFLLDQATQNATRIAAGLAAEGSYIDAMGNPQEGFIGEARWCGVPDYNSSERALYKIVSLEGFCDEVIVRLLENRSGSSVEIEAAITKPTGSSWDARIPPQHSATVDFKVHDILNVALYAQENEYWLCVRSHIDGGIYVPVERMYDNFTLVRGQLTADVDGQVAFSLNKVEALIGHAPVFDELTEITVQPSQYIYATTGTWMNAFYDHTLNAGHLGNWRHTSAFELTPALKGYSQYNTEDRHQFIAESNVLKWDQICDRPITDVYMDGTELKKNKEYSVGGGNCEDHEEVIFDFDTLPPPGSVIVRFRLTEDLLLSSTTASALIVSDDGTQTGPAITVRDVFKRYHGYGNYTDFQGNAEVGFYGKAVAYEVASQVRYYILEMEALYGRVLVSLDEDVGTGVGPFKARLLDEYSQGYRTPKGDVTGMDVWNSHRHADGLISTDLAFANYRPDTLKWELELLGKEFMVVRGNPTGPVSDSDANFQLSNVVLVRGRMPLDDPLTVVNDPPCVFKTSDLVYAAYNIALQAWDTGDAHNFMGHYRGIGGWDEAERQRVTHKPNELPKWIKECEIATVTDVLVDGTELKKKYVPYGDPPSCDEQEAVIATLGPCDTQGGGP